MPTDLQAVAVDPQAWMALTTVVRDPSWMDRASLAVQGVHMAPLGLMLLTTIIHMARLERMLLITIAHMARWGRMLLTTITHMAPLGLMILTMITHMAPLGGLMLLTTVVR